MARLNEQCHSAVCLEHVQREKMCWDSCSAMLLAMFFCWYTL